MIAITALEALPVTGAARALAPGGYAIDIDADGVGRVRLTAPVPEGRIRVSYSAGRAATLEAVPPPVRRGMVLLVAHLFLEREGDARPPAAVTALWRPWRRMGLAGARAGAGAQA